MLAPVRPFTTLPRNRADPTRHHRFLALDRIGAVLDRPGVLAGVHPDRIARASLDAQAAHNAAQLIDLEHRRPLLDPLAVALLGDDRDAVCGAHRGATHAGNAAHGAVVTQHQAVQATEPLR